MIDTILIFVVSAAGLIWFFEWKFELGDAWVIIWIPVVSIAMLLAFGYQHLFYEQVWNERTVVEIGGCNRNSCGVRYSDGSIGEEVTPVVGQVTGYFFWRAK